MPDFYEKVSEYLRLRFSDVPIISLLGSRLEDFKNYLFLRILSLPRICLQFLCEALNK